MPEEPRLGCAPWRRGLGLQWQWGSPCTPAPGSITVVSELGAEERPGAAGDVPPQQLQRAGRNVPGVRTMAGSVRAICSVTGTVAIFSPAVWPGKRGRLKQLWHCRTWPFDRLRGQRDCGLRESLPIRRLLWKCAWRRGDFCFSPRDHSRAARIPSPGEGGRRTVRRGTKTS